VPRQPPSVVRAEVHDREQLAERHRLADRSLPADTKVIYLVRAGPTWLEKEIQ